jgi:hypothetical protein
VQLLTQRIAELPDIPKKILAMYYFENLRLAEIAAVFGLTESRICQIHAQTIIGLRAYLQRVKRARALTAPDRLRTPSHAHPHRRLIVLASTLGGFMLAGGKPLVLLHVSEFVVILGVGAGVLVIASPGHVLKEIVHKTMSCI